MDKFNTASESSNASAPGDVRLTGIVTPLEWDEHDRVTAIGLKTAENDEYLITNSEEFPGLAENLHDLIDVLGKTSEAEDGEFLLRIESIRVHEDPSYDETWGDELEHKEKQYDDRWLAGE